MEAQPIQDLVTLPLVMEIIQAYKSVHGVRDQKVNLVNYSGAEALNKILASLRSKT